MIVLDGGVEDAAPDDEIEVSEPDSVVMIVLDGGVEDAVPDDEITVSEPGSVVMISVEAGGSSELGSGVVIVTTG